MNGTGPSDRLVAIRSRQATMHNPKLGTLIGTVMPLLIVSNAPASPFQSCEAPRYIRTSTVGAEDYETALVVRADSAGRIITAGEFGRSFLPPGYTTVDFDSTDGVDEHTLLGGIDTFVMVTNADGSYAWTNTFGGEGDEYVDDVAVDQSGQIWVVGGFGLMFSDKTVFVDFDPGPGEDIHSCEPDSFCSFVTRYAPDGRYRGTWSNGAPGGTITAKNLAFDPSGNLFYCGFSSDGRFDMNPRGGEDFHDPDGLRGYVTKLSANGRYAWTIILEMTLKGMKLDVHGNLYLAGRFNSYRRYDFDPGPGEDSRGGPGEDRGDMIFITRINVDLSYGWTRMVAAAHDIGDVEVTGLAVDGDDAYLAGYFLDYAEFDPDGSPDPHSDEGSAAWLAKVGTDGAYQWVHAIPSDDGNSHAEDVSADGNGGIYFTGGFAGNTNFDPDGAGDWQFGPGNGSTFVTRLGADRTYHWTGVAGGPGDTGPSGIEATSDGRILIAGNFYSPRGVDFDPTEGEDIRRPYGDYDIFVSNWLCGDCDALLAHGLWTKPRGAVISRVTTNLSGGRVKAQLRSEDGGVSLSYTTRIRSDGSARTRFDNLPPGRHHVHLQWIDDESGARACDGPLMERSASVR